MKKNNPLERLAKNAGLRIEQVGIAFGIQPSLEDQINQASTITQCVSIYESAPKYGTLRKVAVEKMFSLVTDLKTFIEYIYERHNFDTTNDERVKHGEIYARFGTEWIEQVNTIYTVSHLQENNHLGYFTDSQKQKLAAKMYKLWAEQIVTFETLAECDNNYMYKCDGRDELIRLRRESVLRRMVLEAETTSDIAAFICKRYLPENVKSVAIQKYREFIFIELRSEEITHQELCSLYYTAKQYGWKALKYRALIRIVHDANDLNDLRSAYKLVQDEVKSEAVRLFQSILRKYNQFILEKIEAEQSVKNCFTWWSASSRKPLIINALIARSFAVAITSEDYLYIQNLLSDRQNTDEYNMSEWSLKALEAAIFAASTKEEQQTVWYTARNYQRFIDVCLRRMKALIEQERGETFDPIWDELRPIYLKKFEFPAMLEIAYT